MPQSKHILESFNAALDTLHADAMAMAGLAERILDNALKGLFSRNEDLCKSVIADDEDVDQLEKQVDEDGINILLRFQPVATDLRHVVSGMKLIADLERVGDQAVNIARKARKLCAGPKLSQVHLSGGGSATRRELLKPGIGDQILQKRTKSTKRRACGTIDVHPRGDLAARRVTRSPLLPAPVPLSRACRRRAVSD